MSDERQRLRVVPCSIECAKRIVEELHRHHGSSGSARFAVAVADESGAIRGVALIGRPVARVLDDGWTLEVNRVATDGCPNACSALYGAARRMGAALGYHRLVTYIRADEPGSSLRGAGWQSEGAIRARSWNMPGRARRDKTEIVRRERWSMTVGPAPIELEWPTFDIPGQMTLAELQRTARLCDELRVKVSGLLPFTTDGSEEQATLVILSFELGQAIRRLRWAMEQASPVKAVPT